MAVNPIKPIKGIVFAIPFCILSYYHAFAQSQNIRIIWNDTKAKGIEFSLTQPVGDNDNLRITIAGNETPIFGKIERKEDNYVFYPAIPFTYNLQYQVKINDAVIDKFIIPVPTNLTTASVLGVYPSSATIPANLLKIHIRFSQPMQEGQSNKCISIINENGENVQQVFLDLQPELWNSDRTGLTMWLDPGRIKRDLQPNLKLGEPLIVGSNYKVVISKSWRSQNGLELIDDFVKTYHVVQEDRNIPEVTNWEFNYPQVNTMKELIIDFRECLDFELALDAIHIFRDDHLIEGTINLKNKETQLIFTPDSNWENGKYEIDIQSRLEDLAGNNLNRPFDRDLEDENDRPADKENYVINFVLNENSP